jgi:hypothetical protein
LILAFPRFSLGELTLLELGALWSLLLDNNTFVMKESKMRIKAVTLSAFVALLTSAACSQKTGGNAPGTAQDQQQQTPPQASAPDQNALPPGLQNQEPLPSGLTRTRPTNEFGETAISATNQIDGTTNTENITATGRSRSTSRVFGTNSAAGRNEGAAQFQDHAITQVDRALLVYVREAVIARLQPFGVWPPTVHFRVSSGVITLVGTVICKEISEQIEATTIQVPGVTRVINQLVINSAGAFVTRDQALLLCVRQAVAPHLQVGGRLIPINFDVRNGVVTISGSIQDIGEQQRIIDTVRQVQGVTKVDNQITVSAPAPAQVGTALPTP